MSASLRVARMRLCLSIDILFIVVYCVCLLSVCVFSSHVIPALACAAAWDLWLRCVSQGRGSAALHRLLSVLRPYGALPDGNMFDFEDIGLFSFAGAKVQKKVGFR